MDLLFKISLKSMSLLMMTVDLKNEAWMQQVADRYVCSCKMRFELTCFILRWEIVADNLYDFHILLPETRKKQFKIDKHGNDEEGSDSLEDINTDTDNSVCFRIVIC